MRVSAPRSLKQTLGMDYQDMDGCRDDVLEITRPVDDLDEPMDVSEARCAMPISIALISRDVPTSMPLTVTILVLEVGTFTGFSALAWYEGTRATKAEIITLDVRGEVLNFTRKMFSDLGVDDRIKVIEGPAAST